MLSKKLKKYDKYKNSGIEWIGKIPEDWNMIKLKYIAKCFDNERKPLNSEERGKIKGNIPYYGANGIVDYINDYIFDDDIVLLGEDGAPFLIRGKNISFNVNGKCRVNNHTHILKGKYIINKLLTYFLNSVEYLLYIDGTTREKLTKSSMLNIPIISIKNKNQQHQIADFLDKKTSQIDQIIEKRKKQIELLKEKKVALINKAVTKGLDDSVEMKDSGIEWIGEIPKHWEVRKLKSILNKLTDGSHTSVGIQNEGYPYVTVNDIDEKEESIDLINCKKINITDYNFLIKNGCKPKIGDILFSQIGTIGLTVEVKDNSDFVMLSSLAIMSPVKKMLINRWMIYFLRSNIIKNQYKLLMAGGAVKRITLNHINNFIVLYPTNINEQKSIADYLDKMTVQIDSAIEKLEKSLGLLDEYKQSLITNVVTGKVKVF